MIFSGTDHCYTVYFAKGATIVVIHFQKTTKKCGKYKTFVDPNLLGILFCT
jgi:hypothetical protein